jgi:hypothetical protein
VLRLCVCVCVCVLGVLWLCVVGRGKPAEEGPEDINKAKRGAAAQTDVAPSPHRLSSTQQFRTRLVWTTGRRRIHPFDSNTATSHLDSAHGARVFFPPTLLELVAPPPSLPLSLSLPSRPAQAALRGAVRALPVAMSYWKVAAYAQPSPIEVRRGVFVRTQAKTRVDRTPSLLPRARSNPSSSPPLNPFKQQILSKESFTLDELLDEDDLLQECKSLNERLLLL